MSRESAPGARPSTPASLSDEPQQVHVTRSEVLHHGYVFDLKSDTFDYNGDSLTREYMSHPGAVAIIAVDEDDRVALVRQYRHPMRERLWEVPAGLRDVPGEDPLDAAKRELAEEANLAADSWEHLVDYYSSPGGSNEVLRVYLAQDLHSADYAFTREAEESDMEQATATVAELVDGILGGRLHNPSLVVGVLALVAKRSRGK